MDTPVITKIIETYYFNHLTNSCMSNRRYGGGVRLSQK
ncbi:hypothetical protein BH10BAC3_BH10BAC3_18010 [soil metagenome]